MRSSGLGFAVSSFLVTLVGLGCGPGTTTNPRTACPATASGTAALTGTTHKGAISADTTWKAADSPHVITGATTVNGATLTIEACSMVLLDSGVSLSAIGGGTIAGVGTASKPIVFAARGGARWSYLLAKADGMLHLEHATLSGGGSNTGTYKGATLLAQGPASGPYVANLDVRSVTIDGSAGYGVLLQRYAAFAPGSAALTVTGAGAEDAAHPSPLRIDAQALGSVPAGTYTGNAMDRIEVDPFVAIEEHATITDHGVPYWVSNAKRLRVVRAFGSTGPVPTLTIGQGTTIAFEAGAKGGLWVGGSGSSPEPGSLTVSGTASAPVTLTSAAATPSPGDWEGVVFAPGAGAPGATQEIRHAVIEYGGADIAIGGYMCVSRDSSGNDLPEAGNVVIFGWGPQSRFVHDTHLRHGLGWGVFRGWNTSQGASVDFTPTNAFTNLAACEQNDVKDQCPGAGQSVTYACAGTI